MKVVYLGDNENILYSTDNGFVPQIDSSIKIGNKRYFIVDIEYNLDTGDCQISLMGDELE